MEPQFFKICYKTLVEKQIDTDHISYEAQPDPDFPTVVLSSWIYDFFVGFMSFFFISKAKSLNNFGVGTVLCVGRW